VACEQAGITVYLPKPMTSGLLAKGRFGKQDFVYVVADDVYLCPAGEQLALDNLAAFGMDKFSSWLPVLALLPVGPSQCAGLEWGPAQWGKLPRDNIADHSAETTTDTLSSRTWPVPTR
jgi:hypothetical protein